MPSRLLIAIPAALLFSWLGYWSLAARGPEPVNLIDRGLEAERRHDLATAERDLLEAANTDRQYAPRWTLAGFYFRHDRAAEFWRWTREALAVGTRDLGGLFDLCWQETTDRAAVWTRAIPDRKEVWNEYLAYLLAADHWEATVETAGRLVTRSTSADLPVLTAFCDIAIEKKEPASAVPVWNGLCGRGLLASTPIGDGHFVVNGAWERRPTGRGFDWRLSPDPEIRETWMPGALRIAFSGMQSDRYSLCSQPLALPPGRSYRLRYEYRAQSMPADSGVHWRVAVDGADQRNSEGLASNAETTGTFSFAMPQNGRAATLALIYERKIGIARSSGTLMLRRVDLTPE